VDNYGERVREVYTAADDGMQTDLHSEPQAASLVEPCRNAMESIIWPAAFQEAKAAGPERERKPRFDSPCTQKGTEAQILTVTEEIRTNNLHVFF